MAHAAPHEPGPVIADLVDERLVRAHFSAAVFWFVVALTGGILFSFQFLRHYPFVGIELLSPGRVRMVHTNMVAYGFIANAFVGGVIYAIPRLTGQKLLNRSLGWFIYWLWQLAVALTVFGILTGHAQAVEWSENPTWVDPIIAVAWVLMAINIYPAIIRAKEKSMYVSLWYFTAGLLWLGLVHLMGSNIPQYFVPGVSGAAVGGLFIHDLVGLFVTPFGWGLMYYFVPLILKKPIYSHTLSLIGFWGLAFFYPLNGIHHFMFSPIPMYVQYGAVVSTVAVEVVVTSVVINFFMTLRGSGHYVLYNLPIRWFFLGMIYYFTTCLQCAYQVTLSAQKIIHFTDWVVGHSHLVMFGVFGLWIKGFITHLWPRLTRRSWYSVRWLDWHFWLVALGMGIMFVDLTIGGLVQGFSWASLSPWEDSVVWSIPFWGVRTISGFMIIAGTAMWVLNLWLTARKPIADLDETLPESAQDMFEPTTEPVGAH